MLRCKSATNLSSYLIPTWFIPCVEFVPISDGECVDADGVNRSGEVGALGGGVRVLEVGVNVMGTGAEDWEGRILSGVGNVGTVLETFSGEPGLLGGGVNISSVSVTVTVFLTVILTG